MGLTRMALKLPAVMPVLTRMINGRLPFIGERSPQN
jgi:hypothetical protein